jgi:hypothetical protein
MMNPSRTGFSLSQFLSSCKPKTDRLKPVLLVLESFIGGKWLQKCGAL